MRTLWAVAALLAAPVAAADNTLFFQGDTLDVEPVEEQESIPFGMRPVADAGEGSVMEWTYTFEAAGDFRPVQTTFWLEVTQPTAVVHGGQTGAGGANVNACAFYLRLDFGAAGFYYFCSDVYGNEVLEAGTYPLEFAWAEDLEPTAVKAGDTLTVLMTAGFSSPGPNPTVALLQGGPDTPSALVVAGTNEPVEGEEPVVTTTAPPTTTRPPTTTAPRTTTPPPTTAPATTPPASTQGFVGPTTTPPADDDKGSPALAPWAILVAALAVAAVRRRLG